MKTFFTSDHHFFHANIALHCNRPWLRPNDFTTNSEDGSQSWVSHAIAHERMLAGNEYMIERWNSVVGSKDVVHHLGDFMFKRGTLTRFEFDAFVKRLNGHIILYRGNHDGPAWTFRSIFRESHDGFVDRKINGVKITLCHYAMRTWNCAHHGALHLYGHSHGKLAEDITTASFDVGVDCNDFLPLSFEEVTERIKRKLARVQGQKTDLASTMNLQLQNLPSS